MDIKATLKEAREAINNKKYEESLKLSKAVLKEDKTNYMALIFLGLSLQEVGPVEQAPKTFRKAIELNSKNVLAWNGLINYYEKIDSDESKKELVKLYTKVLSLERVEKKVVEYCEKLAKLCDYSDIKGVVETIFNCKKNNVEQSPAICEVLVDLVQGIREFPTEVADKFEECLTELVRKGVPKPEHYCTYLSLLYKQKKYENLLACAEKMHESFETETVSLVWMCKIFNQTYVEAPDKAEAIFGKVSQYYTKLLEAEPQNAIGLFTQSIALSKANDLVTAKETLVTVVSLRPGLIHAWVLLTRMCVDLDLREDAVDSFTMAEKLSNTINNSNVALREILDELSVEILVNSSKEEDWEKALEALKNVSDSNRKCRRLKFTIRVNMNLQRFAEANLLISELKSVNESASKLLLARLFRIQKKYREALDLLENQPLNDAEWWMEIGLLHWDMGQYRKCLAPFLKAAKCNPNSHSCFTYLGRYYQKFEDYDKARRCCEKAFKINPKSPEIGTELSTVYRKLKNWEATQNLLRSITAGQINKKNAWAWLQLGLTYLEQEDHEKAIDHLRYVVRIQPNNVHCWEALADAYLMRGSYISAQKCYEKSIELAEDTLYPLLQIANIKKILGHFVEARKDFEDILFSSGQYVPALKGLAETCMYQARDCYREQRLGTARDHAQFALEKLVTAIRQRSELSCLWKLLGDSCFFVTKLSDMHSCMIVPKAFLECKDVEGTGIAEKEDLYKIATSCYCKAITLVEDNALIWHDLGNCYLHHAADVDDAEKADQLYEYAMSAARHCTTKNPSNWHHWNLLGNVAMRKSVPNYPLAQHAFIKAVTAEHNNAVAWTNLGALYLLQDELVLANNAFSQGQRSDPNYVNCWVGQAVTAELMEHGEAMDLFRHSTQLGQQQQGGLGYGHWVCKKLQEYPLSTNIRAIHDMNAIPVACDALTWYTEKNQYDACAWNMLGILRERIGFRESTLQAYRNAYRLAKSDCRDLARTNYGRMLCKLGNYRDAIKIFEEVDQMTFNSGIGLALALFKDKQYVEAYSAYEEVLQWLTDDSDQPVQSQVLVALGSIAYIFQGLECAKTLLFQSMWLDEPSPWGYYATLSLALLNKDRKLAKVVYKDLEKYQEGDECLKHYAVLRTTYHILKDRPNNAAVEMEKLVHYFPDNRQMWLTFSTVLLRISRGKDDSRSIATSVDAAMMLGKTNMDVSKELCLVSLASSLLGDTKEALISAQKALHCYPHVPECWAVLTSAIFNANRNIFHHFLPAALSHMEKLRPSTNLLDWIKQLKNAL